MRRIGIILTVMLLISNLAYGERSYNFKEHWAYQYYLNLVEQDIFDSMNDKAVDLDQSITIEEFIVLCIQSLNLNIQVENTPDVYETLPYINKALALGIINANEFKQLNRVITREEMALIALRTLGQNEVIYDSVSSEIIGKINDYYNIDDYYKDSVLQSYAVGLLTGQSNGNFSPKEAVSWGEASVIITKLCDPVQRTPFILESIPFITAYYETWTNTGWQLQPIRLFAPKAGADYITDPLDTYAYYRDKNYDRVKEIYNPHEQIIHVKFFDEYQISDDLIFISRLWRFEKEIYPYEINFSSRIETFDEFYTLYEPYILQLSNQYFESEDSFMIENIKRIFDSDESGSSVEYQLSNGRIVKITKNRGLKIEISKKKVSNID